MQLVAVDFLPPTVLQQQMMRVSSLLAAGQITPLCSAKYSLASVVAAMRLLAQASHVGKVRQLVSMACCLNIILVPSACLPLQGRQFKLGTSTIVLAAVTPFTQWGGKAPQFPSSITYASFLLQV